MRGMKKTFWILGLCVVITVAIVVIGTLYYRERNSSSSSSMITNPSSTASTPSTTTAGCLSSGEYAEIPVLNSSAVQVYVKNKTTGNIVSSFQIQNVLYQDYHTFEIHPCGIYVIEDFGQDVTNSFPPGYTVQLWRYDYTGVGKEILTFFVAGPNYTQSVNNYSPDFRIDPNQKYLALEEAPGDASDSIVVDDANTLQNFYTLPISEIAKQNPNIIGNVDFANGGWSSDGRYFWFDFSQEADDLGFVRIDSSNWSYEAFAAPTTTMGGDAFNPDRGMVTYRTNAAPWTGDATIDQEYRNTATQSGQVTSFFIDDLLTGQTYLVATTTDPTYYYQPKWISDSVLQYTLPSGATSTYVVP